MRPEQEDLQFERVDKSAHESQGLCICYDQYDGLLVSKQELI